MKTGIEALRADFDASFAVPRHGASQEVASFLAILLGDRPYALRTTDLGGVHRAPRVTPVPTRSPTLRGLCGVRGSVVAVHDLAALLGEPSSGDAQSWIALSTGAECVAFAFTELQGYLRVDISALNTDAASTRPFTEGIILHEGKLRPVVMIEQLVAAVLGEPG